MQGQFSLAYLLERGTHGASHNLSEAERFYRLSGEHPNKGAVAAAALAIAKLKVVSCLRDYGLDIERWVGFVHLRVRNGLGALSNLVWWFCETALGRTNSSPGEEANGKADGAAFRGGDLGENGTPYLEGRVVETDGNGDALVERPPALLSGALKGFHSAREEWVLLALCVALGFTLGFRWVRQRSRRAASDG